MTTSWPSGVVAALNRSNFQPIGALNNKLIGNTLQATGYTDAAYMAAGGLIGLTSAAPGLVWTHRGGVNVTPDGRFLTGVIARNQIPSSQIGQGGANNAWLYDSATGAWTTLVSGQTAVIWPCLRADGARLVWGQLRTKTAATWPFGAWDIYAADVIAGALQDQRLVFSSTGLGEPYGWDSDGNILYSAPGSPGGGWATNAIFKIADVDGATPIRLTSNGMSEFCVEGPGGRFYFSQAVGALEPGFDLGLELHSMNRDGSDQQRLTFFDPAWLLGVCQVCFPDPINQPKTIRAGVKTKVAGWSYDDWELTLP